MITTVKVVNMAITVLIIGKKTICSLLPDLFSSVLELLSSALRQEKEIKGIEIGKEEIRLFPDNMNAYVENAMGSSEKARLISELAKATR